MIFIATWWARHLTKTHESPKLLRENSLAQNAVKKMTSQQSDHSKDHDFHAGSAERELVMADSKTTGFNDQKFIQNVKATSFHCFRWVYLHLISFKECVFQAFTKVNFDRSSTLRCNSNKLLISAQTNYNFCNLKIKYALYRGPSILWRIFPRKKDERWLHSSSADLCFFSI